VFFPWQPFLSLPRFYRLPFTLSYWFKLAGSYPFDEYRAKLHRREYSIRSYRRTVVLLLHNYVEIIFWFASSYIILSHQFVVEGGRGLLLNAIYSSFATMTSFGSPSLRPLSVIGMAIIWGQSIAGLLMTLLSLTRFIGLLPTPNTLDEHEK